MYVQLSEEDAGFLCDQLKRQLERLENELVHTDSRDMQRALARDVNRLKDVVARIDRVNVRPDVELVRNAEAR